MMALADILRERASCQGRTARVDCGALGSVTVEALPLRECAALAQGPDGDRAVFYAACRELQAAGEELRRAGQVFAPDGVMQYVSDREAAAAARTVLRLSGVELGDDEQEAATPEAADVPEGSAQADGTETPTRSGRPDRPADLPRETDGADTAGQSKEAMPPDGAAAGQPGQTAENRLETVHDFEKQFSEIRPEAVQKKTSETKLRPAAGRQPEKGLAEIRRGTVQIGAHEEEARLAGAGLNAHAPESSGQVSREFEDNSDKNGKARKSDKKTQSLVEKPKKVLQNVAGKTGGIMRKADTGPAGSTGTEDCVHETESEIESGMETALHETESEIQEPLHENKSEVCGALHEAKSEPEQADMSKLHESESETLKAVHEIKSDFGGGLHEAASESSGGTGRKVHECKSEFRETMHEITSEFAEQTARLLLEGLRRAYMVR